MYLLAAGGAALGGAALGGAALGGAALGGAVVDGAVVGRLGPAVFAGAVVFDRPAVLRLVGAEFSLPVGAGVSLGVITEVVAAEGMSLPAGGLPGAADGSADDGPADALLAGAVLAEGASALITGADAIALTPAVAPPMIAAPTTIAIR